MSKSTNFADGKQVDDIARRRAILSHHIGQEVQFKQSGLRPNDHLRVEACKLLDVKRTRVLIGYETGETLCGEPVVSKWLVPIDYLLLPGSVEPALGQRPLFNVEVGGEQ